jgi:hypothetical protein
MLWGSRAGRRNHIAARQAARAPLRESLSVTDDSPLKDPDLRNDFEHFDERLEDWFNLSEHHNYVGRTIGPPNAVITNTPEEHFQHFDPRTTRVSFWEHESTLNEIVREAHRLGALAAEEALKPHWDPPEPQAEVAGT